MSTPLSALRRPVWPRCIPPVVFLHRRTSVKHPNPPAFGSSARTATAATNDLTFKAALSQPSLSGLPLDAVTDCMGLATLHTCNGSSAFWEHYCSTWPPHFRSTQIRRCSETGSPQHRG